MMSQGNIIIKNEESYQMEPFGGLVPDTVKGRVLAEIVADPHSEYTPKDMGELTDSHPNTANSVLKEFVKIGLVKTTRFNNRQPVYEACGESKRLTALTFLALATKDDELGENCMDRAVCDYVRSLGFLVINSFTAVGVQAKDDRGQPFLLTSIPSDKIAVGGVSNYG
jgi:hypothetical protein